MGIYINWYMSINARERNVVYPMNVLNSTNLKFMKNNYSYKRVRVLRRSSCKLGVGGAIIESGASIFV